MKTKCPKIAKKDPLYKLEKSKTFPTDLPKLKILAQRPLKYVEMDLDVPDEVLDEIAAYGMKLIKGDKQALFNYAFTKMLEELCKESLPGKTGKGRSQKSS